MWTTTLVFSEFECMKIVVLYVGITEKEHQKWFKTPMPANKGQYCDSWNTVQILQRRQACHQWQHITWFQIWVWPMLHSELSTFFFFFFWISDPITNNNSSKNFHLTFLCASIGSFFSPETKFFKTMLTCSNPFLFLHPLPHSNQFFISLF